jgi:hypothetical protein
MKELSRCLAMASICRVRALEDKERRAEWLTWADAWNQLAGQALVGNPVEGTVATRSSDPAQFDSAGAD